MADIRVPDDLAYVTYRLGYGYDTPYGVAVDGSGNIFVAGDVRVKDHYEWTVRKYDPNGNVLWNDQPFHGTAQGITLMPGGEVVVTGQKNVIFPPPATSYWQTIRYGSSNAAPTEIWSCEFNQPVVGGMGQSVVKMKDCDDIAVVGYKDIGTGTQSDWYILRYSGAGNLLAYQSFNGPINSNDQALSVSLDPTNGDILVAGWETDTTGNGDINWVVRRLRESYLAVSVTSSPANVAPGQAFSIIATVTNPGSGTVYVVTPQLMVNSGGGLVTVPGTPIPVSASLGGGSSINFTWTFTAVCAGSVTFSVTATGLACGTCQVAAVGGVSMQILAPILNISVLKQQDPAAPGIGDAVTYRVIVTNTGGATVENLMVTDTLPSMVMNATAYEPSGFPTPTVTSVSGGTQFWWSRSGFTMFPGTSYTFTISGRIGLVCAITRVSNTAYVVATTSCASTAYTTNAVGAQIQPAFTNMSVRKDQIPAAPVDGDAVQYRIIVTNTGSATITNVSVTDTISSVIVNASTAEPSGFGPPSTVSVMGTGTRYVWAAAGLTFNTGSSYTFTISGKVGLICAATNVSNTAFVTANSLCPNTTAVMFTNLTSFTVTPRVTNVSVVKIQNPPSPDAGDTVTYNVVVTNNGTATITSLSVTDTISPVIINSTAYEPSGFPAPVVTQTASGTQYNWSATGITLNLGETYTFTISGSVGDVCVQTMVSNTAWVVAGAGCTPARIYTNETDFLLTAPVLAFTAVKQSVPAAPGVGESITYRVIVANTGGETIENMTVVDTISPVIVNAGTVEPVGFGPPMIASIVGTGTRYVWTGSALGMLPGAVCTFTITGSVGAVTNRTEVRNAAYVGARGGCDSAAVLTNEMNFKIEQPRLAPVIVAKKYQEPLDLFIDGPLTYQIVVRNAGATTIDSLTVTDTVSPVITGITTDQPPGFGPPVVTQVIYIAGTRYAWSGTGLMMLPGMSLTFTVTGTIGVVLVPTVVSNTAYVIAGNPFGGSWKFTNRATGSSDAVGTIVQPDASGLSIVKNQLPSSPGVGDSVTYRILVDNVGSRTQWNLVIWDSKLPVVDSWTTVSWGAPAGTRRHESPESRVMGGD